MMAIRNLFPLICLIFVSLSASAQEGYDIKIKINGLTEKQIILGHYLGKSMYPDDTIYLDSKGTGNFKGIKALDEGMYLIYLPSTKYFEIIIGKDQSFSLETDTIDFVKTLSFKGSDENQIFIDFQIYMINLRKSADSISQLINSQKNPSAKERLSNELKKINQDRMEKIEKINNEKGDLFVGTFLKATLDITVPDPPKDEKGVVKDPDWQYYYYRKHYFDNFNFTDPRLLRTPIYEDKIMNYLTKVVPQVPDTLIKQVDYFIEKSKADSGVFRYMLITFFNYYIKSNLMGMDAVMVNIAEEYYIPDAWWSDEKYISNLKDDVTRLKPLLIGKTAPDIELMLVPTDHFKTAITDTAMKKYPHVGTLIKLQQIKSKYLVLLFWDPECGHCKTIVPQLHELYNKNLKQKSVQILAVTTLSGEDGKIKWIDFVNQHNLTDWANAWNPYSFDFKLKYDILTTPQIYLLDENKKIIAKKISPEQIEEIINSISE